MGVLRILLALAVVAGHSQPILGFTLLAPSMAVQTFYIISGFYMALVLDGKYRGVKGGYKLFITNRVLRLLPPYWFACVLSFVFLMLYARQFDWSPVYNFETYGSSMSASSIAYFLFGNLFILGQDLALFLGFDPVTGNLFWTNGVLPSPVRVGGFMLVPQAWSLSLELMFYLIVPFAMRWGRGAILGLILTSVGIRIALAAAGFELDPWSYRFFPSELALFLLGTFAYLQFKAMKFSARTTQLARNVLGPLTIIMALIVPFVWVEGGWKKLAIFYIVIAALIPFLFELTKRNRFDRFCGELSYPIYLVHMVVVLYLGIFHGAIAPYHGLIASVVSILIAVFMYFTLVRPLDRYRERRLKNNLSL